MSRAAVIRIVLTGGWRADDRSANRQNCLGLLWRDVLPFKDGGTNDRTPKRHHTRLILIETQGMEHIAAMKLVVASAKAPTAQ